MSLVTKHIPKDRCVYEITITITISLYHVREEEQGQGKQGGWLILYVTRTSHTPAGKPKLGPDLALEGFAVRRIPDTVGKTA